MTSFFITTVSLLAIILVVAECNAYRSTRWDTHMENVRQKRSPRSEWQSRDQNEDCMLTNLDTYDALGRRASGILATPQRQGRCGNCWAFAATHTYTDYLSITAGTRQEVFSQDYMTKCNRNTPNNNGCCGGNINSAFNFLSTNGAVSKTCLPYTLETYLPIRGSEQDFKRANPLVCPSQMCDNPANSFDPESNQIQ